MADAVPRRERLVSGLCLTLILSIVAPMLLSCSTIQIPDYPQAPADSLKNQATMRGLRIGAHAVTDKDELDRYFGTDLLADKVLPIYIVAENTNHSSSFVLSQDAMSLLRGKSEDNLRQGDRTVTGRSPGGEVVALVGAALLGLPAVFGGFKAVSNATVVKQNLASKPFRHGPFHLDSLFTGSSISIFRTSMSR